MRALILDTETTGLDPATGDRVLEVAAIEVVNFMPTGREFHRLIDPQRDVPEEAARIHGFTREMLAGKPLFDAILPDLLDFLADDPVVAHNAPFDFGFLDAELVRAEGAEWVIDTSTETFPDDLVAALKATGATIASSVPLR